jgi:GNAT superfamily N-acetyltransferase
MDILQKRYPRPVDGGLQLRPLLEQDERALVAFFQRIPADERQLFQADVTDPSVVHGWVETLDYENVLPLLVLDGDGVVGDATLHRDPSGWSRHVGKIRITLDSGYRGRGLAKLLIQEFVELARPLRLGILHAEVLAVQTGARALFEDLGFRCIATLPQYVIDLSSRVHDLLIYQREVTPSEELAAEIGVDTDLGKGV